LRRRRGGGHDGLVRLPRRELLEGVVGEADVLVGRARRDGGGLDHGHAYTAVGPRDCDFFEGAKPPLMGLHFLRLVTLHPALVHFTIGLLPIIVIAYVVAAWRGSERWRFTADVALWIATAFTLLTFAFGLASWYGLEWPGGLGAWPTVHLVLGCVGTGLFVLL